MITWTPELDNAVRQDRRNGWTYLAISERLGLSKGQVIGRAERLGLLKNGNGAMLHGPRGWSEDTEKRQLAMEMRAAGRSFSDIGRAVGVSKNQVSGVANREKWPAPERLHAPKAERVEVVIAPVKTLPDLPSVAPVVFAAPEVVMAKPAPKSVRPVELSSRQCSFILNDGILPDGRKGWLFCEDKALAGKPYCAVHSEVAYVKPQRRGEAA